MPPRQETEKKEEARRKTEGPAPGRRTDDPPQEKAQELDWEARRAYRAGEHQQALNWALKKLKLYPADENMMTLARRCASKLNDQPALLLLFGRLYREGFSDDPK